MKKLTVLKKMHIFIIITYVILCTKTIIHLRLGEYR